MDEIVVACLSAVALGACSSEHADGRAFGLCGRLPSQSLAAESTLQDGITVGVADDFGIGFEKSSAKGLSVAIADADPLPPDRTTNAWTIEVRDQSGNPLDGLSTEVRLRMPEHDHFGQMPVTASAIGAGQYRIADLQLWMPGLWNVTFVFQASTANEDQVLFTVCIDQ